MPRLPIDYSNAVIYKLSCKDKSITEIYIGSTTNFRKRKWEHKYGCNNLNNRSYNMYVYQFIRENGGFVNWDMVQIEEIKFNTRQELHMKERYYIEQLKAGLNKIIPTRTKKEWNNENKEKMEVYKKEYREINKEKTKILNINGTLNEKFQHLQNNEIKILGILFDKNGKLFFLLIFVIIFAFAYKW